jgi:hypothetical protein
MKPLTIFGIIAVAAIAAFGVYMVDIDMTEEARLPSVDVNVEPGELPAFSADVGDIETGSEEITLTVPTIDIESPEEDAQNDS